MGPTMVGLMKRKGIITMVVGTLALAGCGASTSSSYETPGEISEQLHSESIPHTINVDEYELSNPTLHLDGDDGWHMIWLESFDDWHPDEIMGYLEPGESAAHGDDWVIIFDDGIGGSAMHEVADALGGDVTVG